MTRSTASAVRAATVAATVVLATSLASCGQSRVAASMGDAVVTVDEVADVQTDMARAAAAQAAEQGAPPPRGKTAPGGQIALKLLAAPLVLQLARAGGKSVSPDQAKSAIVAEKVPDPTAAAIRFVQTTMALQNLEPKDRQLVVSQLTKGNITVNPRYGVFDRQNLSFAAQEPDWIGGGGQTPPAGG